MHAAAGPGGGRRRRRGQFDLGECLNDALGFVKDIGHFPNYNMTTHETISTCLAQTKATAKLRPDDVYKCARNDGPALQNEAAGEGQKRGIAFAPTLFIDGKQTSGSTISVKQICDAYKGSSKPAACKSAQADPPAATTIAGRRCPV